MPFHSLKMYFLGILLLFLCSSVECQVNTDMFARCYFDYNYDLNKTKGYGHYLPLLARDSEVATQLQGTVYKILGQSFGLDMMIYWKKDGCVLWETVMLNYDEDKNEYVKDSKYETGDRERAALKPRLPNRLNTTGIYFNDEQTVGLAIRCSKEGSYGLRDCKVWLQMGHEEPGCE